VSLVESPFSPGNNPSGPAPMGGAQSAPTTLLNIPQAYQRSHPLAGLLDLAQQSVAQGAHSPAAAVPQQSSPGSLMNLNWPQVTLQGALIPGNGPPGGGSDQEAFKAGMAAALNMLNYG